MQPSNYGLYLVGSTVSGFALDTSDVDMCLVSRRCTALEPRQEALAHLLKLVEILRESCRFFFLSLCFRYRFARLRWNSCLLQHFWAISIWFMPKYRYYALTIHCITSRWIWITITVWAFAIHTCSIVIRKVCDRIRWNICTLQNALSHLSIYIFVSFSRSGLAATAIGRVYESMGTISWDK